MTERRTFPLVLGHHGFRARYPENTFLAFSKAFDVVADGRYIVIHDDTVDRVSNGRGSVAANELTAMRMMRAAAAEGLSIPRDLALVGFDDIDAAARLSVPLTMVAQPRREIGVKAASLLLDRLEGARSLRDARH